MSAETCLIVDDGSVVLVKEVQGEGVFVTANREPAGPSPGGIMGEHLVCVKLPFIDRKPEELTRPAIWLARRIADYYPAAEIRRGGPKTGRGLDDDTIVVNSDSRGPLVIVRKLKRNRPEDIVSIELRSAASIFRALLLQE